jgi:hypothetical protein
MNSPNREREGCSKVATNLSPAARLIAFYLPQFHPIPENDLWWGRGFTEWTNVAKAKPLFPGHYQPHVPADLGFYDLRLPEVRAVQADMARAAGIEGFCYWHYWFNGRRILERPFNEVLRLKEPNFPFCLGWANHTWNAGWHGESNKVLIEQTYPGQADYERHFYAVLEAFQDPRYIRVRGMPVFVVYRPIEIPAPEQFIEIWQRLAIQNGLPGIHFVAHLFCDDQPYDYRTKGFSASIASDAFQISAANRSQKPVNGSRGGNGERSLVGSALFRTRQLARTAYPKALKRMRLFLSRPHVFEYSDAMRLSFSNVTSEPHCYPMVLPNWDDSPRRGARGIIFVNSTPESFRPHLRKALHLVRDKTFEDRIIFVKSWNEWAEGNYLEPDLRFGHQYLDVVREEVMTLSGCPKPTREAADVLAEVGRD